MTRIGWLGIVALAAAGCRKNKDGDGEDSDTADKETDTGTEGFCGDGVIDSDEECDLGGGNGAGENCLSDCSASDQQIVEVSGADVVEEIGLDATGVTDGMAPAGDGAWTPSDTDEGNDGLAKFEMYIPLYDYRDELSPQQLDALSKAPYQPPTLHAPGWR